MKRYITIGLFSILCICLVAQTTKTYNIPFNREDFTITQVGDFHQIESDKHDLRYETDILKPAIPYVIIRVLLPDMQEMTGYSFNATIGSQDNSINLCSNPQFLPSDTIIDSFNMSLSYPSINYPFRVDFTNVGTIDGYHIAKFKIFPISYDSNQAKLIWASNIELSITTTHIESTSNLHKYHHRGNKQEILQNILINPQLMAESISMYSSPEINEVIDYIIITSSELVPAFELLAEWKRTKGIRTKIITTDSIYNHYDGSTNQLKIKQCIKDYYENNNTEYVLLGGDDIIIPVQRCYVNVIDKDRNNIADTIPTDLFYSCLDEPFDWNPNGDNYIGHVDDSINLHETVFATRLPIQNIDDAYSFIDKLLAYERDSYQSNHFTKMLLAGVVINNINSVSQKSDAEYRSNKMYEKYIKPYWEAGNITRFFDTGTDFEGGNSYDVNVEHLQEQLGINNGYHFVHMKAHGDQISWDTETGYPYYSTDALNLYNPQSNIITTTSCHTNAFDAHGHTKYNKDPCLSEAFIRNPDCGVIAYVGGSRSGWTYTNKTFGPSLLLNSYFYNSLFRDKIHNFGKIVAHAKDCLDSTEDAYRWVLYSVNPIGDPEMPIYTTVPQKFNLPTYCWNGSTLQVDTPIDSCTITITDKATKGKTYFQTYKNVQQVSFSGLEKGDYTLCITKHNYIPYLATIKSQVDYIQQENITDNKIYTGQDIRIGSDVTTEKKVGYVIIEAESSVTIDASNSVTIENGFNCKKGAMLEIK